MFRTSLSSVVVALALGSTLLFATACESVPAADDPRDLIDATPVFDADLRTCTGEALPCAQRGTCQAGCIVATGCFNDNIALCDAQLDASSCLDANVDCDWIGDSCILVADTCKIRETEGSCNALRQTEGVPCTWGSGCAGTPNACLIYANQTACLAGLGCSWSDIDSN